MQAEPRNPFPRRMEPGRISTTGPRPAKATEALAAVAMAFIVLAPLSIIPGNTPASLDDSSPETHLLAVQRAGAAVFGQPSLSGELGLEIPQGATKTPRPSLGFVANAGQIADDGVRFAGSDSGLFFGFAKSAVLVETASKSAAAPPKSVDSLAGFAGRMDHPEGAHPEAKGAVLEIRFNGSNEVLPVARNATETSVSYFLGSDPATWLPSIRTYREVVYEGLYEGVDLIYHSTEAGIKYDFVLAPGVDPAVIEMAYGGADAISLDGRGGLEIMAQGGRITDSSPVSFQQQTPAACSFVLRGGSTVGFDCPDLDQALPLVIDPLVSVLYYGGSGDDDASFLATDASGGLYVIGLTASPEFVASPGAFNNSSGGLTQDVYVGKLNANRTSFSFLSIIGGGGSEVVRGLVVDASGNAYAAGDTSSGDFPTTAGAFDRTYNGTGDCFLFKLSADGARLLYSTLLGGSEWDACISPQVDPSGQVEFGGATASPELPTTPGALNRTSNGGLDGFVGRLAADGGALLFLTFVGGEGDEYVIRLAPATDGSTWVGMTTSSRNLSVTPDAFDTSFSGGSGWGDVAVMLLSPSGASTLYSTYIGGSGDDEIFGMALAADGSLFVSGTTNSSDFPVTSGAFDTAFGGADNSSYSFKGDIFLSKVGATGGLLFSTYIGGSGDDDDNDLRLSPNGDPVIVAMSTSANFPVTPNAFDTTANGDFDGAIVVLDSNLSRLKYSTFIGGNGADEADGITFGTAGEVYVSGQTNSTNFPNNSVPYNGTFGDGSYNGYLLTLLIFSPEGLRLHPQNGVIALSWDPFTIASNASLQGFRIYQRDPVPPNIMVSGFSTDTTYIWISLRNGKQYCFRVAAVTALGETEAGAEVCGTPAGIPSSPRAFTAQAGERSVSLSWQTPIDSGAVDLLGYRLFRADTNSSLTYVASATAQSYTDTNVTAGVTYTYQILAFNDVWDGDRSPVVTAVPFAVASTTPVGIATVMWVGVVLILASFAVMGFSSRGSLFLSLLLAVPLFTRLRRDDVRSQYNRGRIVQFVDDHPGATYSEIRKRLDLPNGNCAYHLRVLERSGELRRTARGASLQFYPSSVRPGAEGLPPLTEDQRSLLDIILQTGGGETGAIAEALRARDATKAETDVSYHLRVLNRRASLISAERTGRRTVYFVTAAQRENLEGHLPPDGRFIPTGFGATAPDSRQREVLVSLPDTALAIVPSADHVRGLVRLKVAFENRTGSEARDLGFEIDYDGASLRLVRVDPECALERGRYSIGDLPSGKTKCLEFFFDPKFRADAHFDGNLKYRDGSGSLKVAQMKTWQLAFDPEPDGHPESPGNGSSAVEFTTRLK